MEVRFRPGGRQAPRPPLARRAGAPHFVRRAWTGLTADPAPSTADVQMTRQIIEVAKPLGITVHDHIIIGKSGHASLKAQRFI